MFECEKTLSEGWMLPADTPLSLRPIAAKALSVVQSGQGYPVDPPPFHGNVGVWTVALGEEIRLPAFVIKLTLDPNRGLTKPAECIDLDPTGPTRRSPCWSSRQKSDRPYCLNTKISCGQSPHPPAAIVQIACIGTRPRPAHHHFKLDNV